MSSNYQQRSKMTVAVKLWAGLGTITLVLAAVGLVNYLTVNDMVGQSRDTLDDSAMDTELTQREVDHLVWVHKLRDFLAEDGATLQVEIDHRQCGFGRWYYGDGRLQLTRLLPGLEPLLRRIEKPHRDLHESAVALQLAKSKPEEEARQQVAAIYAARTLPALAETQSLLKQIREELRSEVTGRRETLESAMNVSG